MSGILERSRKRKITDWLISLDNSYILLVLLVALLALNNAIWLRTDTYLPTVDGAYYLVKSLEALDTIQRPGRDTIPELYYQSFGPRPTFFFVAFAIPFYLLFGPTADVAILGTNTIFYAVIVFATYGLGKMLFDRRVGLLAAFVVSVNPGVSVLSIRYWPHLGVVATVALGAYLVLGSDRFRSKKRMLAFGVLLGIALLMRPVFPALFLLAPTLFVALRALFWNGLVETKATIRSSWPQLLRDFRSRIVFGLLPALLIVTCLAGPFYWRYSAEILRFVAYHQETILSGELSKAVGGQSFFWYLSNMPDDISLSFFVLFVAGATLALVKYRAKNGLLLYWFAVSYILASVPAFKAFFYFAPIYVAVAILSVFWVSCVKNKRIRCMVVALILAIGFFTFVVASWNITPLPQPIMQAMKIAAHPPQRGDWKLEETVAFLGEQTSSSSRLTVGTACFLGNSTEPTLAYYTTLQGLDIEYLADPLSALLDADYVVTRTRRFRRSSRPDHFAWLVSSVVDNEASAFHMTHVLIKDFSLPGGTQAKVYKRVSAPSHEETVAITSEVIDLDPDNVSAYLRLADAHLSREELGQATAAYVREIDLEPDNALAHSGLGQAYQAEGELDLAIAECQEAVRLSPSHALYHEQLGTFYRQQGRLEEAAAEYEMAVKLNPRWARAYWGLGVSYERLGRIEQAMECYEKVLRINPGHMPAQERLEELSSAGVEDCEHTLWRSLGEAMAFLGYGVQPRSVEAGGTLEITLWWQALGEMDRDYTVFIHVVGPDGGIWGQQDRLLVHAGDSTSTWEVGETVREWHKLQIAPDAPPGEYVVKAGLYYWETIERLPVWGEAGQRITDDAILLGPITVDD